MKIKETHSEVDSYQVWAQWSPGPKKKPLDLARVASAIVVATSALQIIGLPMV